MKNEQTTFDRLRSGARKNDPVYEDFEQRLIDENKLRIGCSMFVIVAVVAFALFISLVMGPRG